MKNIYSIITLCLLFVSTAVAQLPNGSIAPDWTMTDINGNEHHLYDYLDDGYTVVLDFSATWCGPCWSYHNSGALEELYINHGPAGMANVSEDTTDDVMVIFIEGDGDTNSDDLNGTGTNTQGDWVTNTPYPIIDDDAITSTYMISAWPTIYTICSNREINVSGQISTEAHYELTYACAVASLDYGVNYTSTTIQDGEASNSFGFDVTTTGDASEALMLTLVTDAPSDWSATIEASGATSSSSLPITVVGGNNIPVDLVVTPGTTPALANYSIQITSIDNPSAVTLIASFFVAHDVTDIVVDHGGVATQWNEDFLQGLALANNTTYGLLKKDKFVEAIEAGQLSDVGHLYYNMAWNFPSFDNQLVSALSTFLDGGGNLYVAGQDIGWDTWDSNAAANGTAATRDFYTDYLSTDYQADGSGSNSSMNWTEGEEVFTGIATSAVVDVNNGNLWPDEISPIAPATAIMHYGSDVNKVGGTRVYENDHKVVYLGIDQGMIADEAVRRQVITIAHNWFHGLTTGIELDEAFANAFGNNYPNPAVDFTIIPFENLLEDVTITLMDVQGKIVLNDKIAQGSTSYRLNLSDLDAGTYHYVIVNAKGQATSNPIEVIK